MFRESTVVKVVMRRKYIIIILYKIYNYYTIKFEAFDLSQPKWTKIKLCILIFHLLTKDMALHSMQIVMPMVRQGLLQRLGGTRK